MMNEPTWEPHTRHGELSEEERAELPESAFAFPEQRKLLLTDTSHVIKALARFHQVKGVSEEERDHAFENIKKAAEFYDVRVVEHSWREIGKRPNS